MMTFEDFMFNIDVMKPSSAGKDNLRDQVKLDKLLDDRNYAAEEKYDGCRYKCANARFFSKDNVEKTANVPHLVQFFKLLKMPNLFLDGELWYPGKTSQFCTRVTGAAASTALSFQQEYEPIHYVVYDILRLPNGEWLTNRTYSQRRKLLETFFDTYVKNTPMEQFLHLSSRCVEDKRTFLESILSEGKEGVVLKRLDSVYHMGKKPKWEWMKIKQNDEADLFISGFEEPTREYTGGNITQWPYWREVNGISVPVTKLFYMNWIGAIELSAFVDGVPKKICTVSGMDERIRAQISQDANSYLGKVVRVSYMERTEAGYPRHPAFVSFHETKTSSECTWELNLGEG